MLLDLSVVDQGIKNLKADIVQFKTQMENRFEQMSIREDAISQYVSDITQASQTNMLDMKDVNSKLDDITKKIEDMSGGTSSLDTIMVDWKE